jgi:peptidoglycan hydrolase-like protein with peptidoglycan-binding domain
MYKAIVTAAAVALSAPASAEQPAQQNQQIDDQNAQPGNGQAAQPQSRPGPAPQIRAGQPISPQLLNSHQVREIQQALEARRGGSVRVDGEWGPDIEAALRDFQRSENMISQNGELDALTLMALGLNPLSYGLSGPGETTGQALRDGPTQRERAQDAQGRPATEQDQ